MISIVLRRFVAPVVLVAVAATQAWRVRAFDQSPWKGGGFGMFSTTDKPASRVIRCRAIRGDTSRSIAIPNRMAETAAQTQTVPTQERLAKFASLLARCVLVEKTGVGVLRVLDPDEVAASDESPYEPDEITVSLWKIAFDAVRGEDRAVHVTDAKAKRASE